MKSDVQSRQGIVQFDWGLSRIVKLLVGSEIEILFDVGDLRKKYLKRCKFSSSKKFLVQFHDKWFPVLSRNSSNGLTS